MVPSSHNLLDFRSCDFRTPLAEPTFDTWNVYQTVPDFQDSGPTNGFVETAHHPFLHYLIPIHPWCRNRIVPRVKNIIIPQLAEACARLNCATTYALIANPDALFNEPFTHDDTMRGLTAAVLCSLQAIMATPYAQLVGKASQFTWVADTLRQSCTEFHKPVDYHELTSLIYAFRQMFLSTSVLQKPYSNRSVFLWELFGLTTDNPSDPSMFAGSQHSWPALTGPAAMTQVEMMVSLVNRIARRVVELIDAQPPPQEGVDTTDYFIDASAHF